MQNIKISISFHSTTHNHENAKHMQTQNTGERNKVLGERNGEKKKKKKSRDSMCFCLIKLMSNDRLCLSGIEAVIRQRPFKTHRARNKTSGTLQRRREAKLYVIISATPCTLTAFDNHLRLQGDAALIQRLAVNQHGEERWPKRGLV